MLQYLLKNRSRPPAGSRAFFAVWAKRLQTLPTLLRFSTRRWNLVRKGAQIAESACIGDGTMVGRPSNLRVGDFSFIGRAELMLHGELNIGANVCINDGVIILTATHDVDDPAWRQIAKTVHIEDYAWIASHAKILPGVRIGRGAVVGACAVVSKDVPPGAIVVGNPARILNKKRPEELTYRPVSFLAFQGAWLNGANHT